MKKNIKMAAVAVGRMRPFHLRAFVLYLKNLSLKRKYIASEFSSEKGRVAIHVKSHQ